MGSSGSSAPASASRKRPTSSFKNSLTLGSGRMRRTLSTYAVTMSRRISATMASMDAAI
jgi:hypothetical protein